MNTYSNLGLPQESARIHSVFSMWTEPMRLCSGVNKICLILSVWVLQGTGSVNEGRWRCKLKNWFNFCFPCCSWPCHFDVPFWYWYNNPYWLYNAVINRCVWGYQLLTFDILSVFELCTASIMSSGFLICVPVLTTKYKWNCTW